MININVGGLFMGTNKSYSAEFKIQIVEDILSGEETIRSSAKNNDISHELIRQWIKHYQEDGPDYFMAEHRGRPKTNKSKFDFDADPQDMTIEEKEAYLNMAIAMLKKAKALALIR